VPDVGHRLLDSIQLQRPGTVARHREQARRGGIQRWGPEQAAAEADVGPACDIYALGCVLHEMLTGEPPFSGPNAQAVIARHLSQAPASLLAVQPDLPSGVDAAVRARYCFGSVSA
jgi:serine/threonine protein kinase